ncbi:MAG: hypothetical protein QXS20_06345 [Candidatus Thorarchaeota archaeon]
MVRRVECEERERTVVDMRAFIPVVLVTGDSGIVRQVRHAVKQGGSCELAEVYHDIHDFFTRHDFSKRKIVMLDNSTVPDSSCEEALRRIRQIDTTSWLIVISANPNARETVLSLGADAFLELPFKPDSIYWQLAEANLRLQERIIGHAARR